MYGQARERDARLLDLEKKNSKLSQRNAELSLMLDKVFVLRVFEVLGVEVRMEGLQFGLSCLCGGCYAPRPHLARLSSGIAVAILAERIQS